MSKITFFVHTATLSVLMLTATAFAQGTFQNLDFESAIITPDPNASFQVYANSALPSWTPSISGFQKTDIVYDTISGSIAAVSIHDAQSHTPPLEGNYSIYLQGGQTAAGASGIAQIAQTAVVPVGSQSIQLALSGTVDKLQVTLGGQTLSLTPLTTTPTFTIYGASIAWAAGSLNTLQLNALPNGFIMVDGIQFLTTPAPEPSTIGLLATGAMALAFKRRHQFATALRSDG